MNRVVEAWRSVGQESLNLPNFITLVRILLIPVFVLLFFTPTADRSLSAAVVFVVAAITDLLDGYIARRTGQVTKLGKLLDPVADKLLVLSALILEGTGLSELGNLHLAGTVTLYLSLVFGYISGGQYVWSFWKQVVAKGL